MDQNTRTERISSYTKDEQIKGRVMGHGLLLVQDGNYFYLWNPSIGYHGEKLSNNEFYSSCFLVLWLCFDSNNGDYKALIFIYDGRFVMVGSFKRKTWTRVEFPSELSSISLGPVLNDCLHLLACNAKSYSEQIIYFDPKNDEFVDVPSPEGHTDISALGAIDGCLCMVSGKRRGKFEILVMKGYGVKGSWTTLFKIKQGKGGDSYTELEPLFFTEDKDTVLIRTRDRNNWHAISVFDLNGEYCTYATRVSESTTIVYEETFIKPMWV